ncbi:hypothetical protein FHW84_002325 [Dyella sp. SG562]|uniref:hypothetical protein n=1 Tax=Dyella sp. SG562 TaxID=2587017 RepID=UPI001FBBFFEE|nr:hypothetical protein [Dyella sp. SG562]NII73752.1 hypothetical protein [Dyella sp. SG562]
MAIAPEPFAVAGVVELALVLPLTLMNPSSSAARDAMVRGARAAEFGLLRAAHTFCALMVPGLPSVVVQDVAACSVAPSVSAKARFALNPRMVIAIAAMAFEAFFVRPLANSDATTHLPVEALRTTL